LDAKVWDSPETVTQLFSTSDVVKIRGTVEHYNEKPQLIVSRIRRCEPHDTTLPISILYHVAIRTRCSANSRHL
jgi:23S rRNA maturation-related 3'-5' exoribonuclease YhaM